MAEVPGKTCEEIRQGALQEVGVAPQPEKIHNVVRDTYRKIRRWGIGWKVCIDVVNFEFEDGTVVGVDYLHPRKLLQYLLENDPVAIHGGNPDSIAAFWEGYHGFHDSHEAYVTHSDMGKVIPVCLHGDEGRGKRRSQTTVVSWESVLGMAAKPINCNTCKASISTEEQQCGENPLCQQLVCNLKGHSFLQHFPLFTIPGTWWKTYKTLTFKMLERVASDFHELFYNGVQTSDGSTWHVAAVGSKGDLKWFSKICQLTRGYENKSPKVDVPHCHYCLGGSPGLPAEDLGSQPCWLATLHVERPWSERAPPALDSIPFDAEKPEFFYKHDTFHTLRLGIFRHFCGSTIFLLLCFGYFGSSDVPTKLECAHGYFRLWQLATGKHASLRSFTKNLFVYKNQKSFPWCNVKGSDCGLILLWLRTMLVGILAEGVKQAGHQRVLEVVLSTCEMATDFYDIVVKHNMFLTRSCGSTLIEKGRCFLNGYCILADYAFSTQWCLYAIIPKAHFTRHIIYELESQLNRGNRWLLSPLIFDCCQNEDFMGRICKMGRRIDARVMGFRILENYLIKAGILHKRAKKPKGVT